MARLREKKGPFHLWDYDTHFPVKDLIPKMFLILAPNFVHGNEVTFFLVFKLQVLLRKRHK